MTNSSAPGAPTPSAAKPRTICSSPGIDQIDPIDPIDGGRVPNTAIEFDNVNAF
jgi:hypothetical protein